ncbi:MAG: hypothetical protein K0S16_1452 [Moraxellaceae bacterium]|jgi:4-aminobutyrate aminotransferase-like enzyme|nr:hypothetical protein [Moraxellaceae bacterium]
MKTLWKAFLISGVMGFASAALAEEAAAPAAPEAAATAPAEAAPAEGAPAPGVVQVSATGDQVVTVNTGNETVDAAANLAAKCTERTAAMKTCDSIGGFKAIACRKLAEVRYREVKCPL